MLASLFHVASTKENNNHLHNPNCPEEPDRWCRYNRDRERNTTSYKPGPGLPMSIVMKLRPIYVELSSDHLLQNVYMVVLRIIMRL